ncbi:MAG TPA: AMP-binding protein [Leptolyngbyaceae cyanobacterium M33_DOE_097]|uniref:Long-chain fatty acid--CoA ligase n=1 Tax=Oscillatoriales cyanobacterium SpSt-418 TaxID=2282169 RepID=A0A7C3KGI3_9CYAN|nr:AMP-binding protein [Leptolyngbyaceae cyanobacterium M33_DOE_097]
MNGSPFLAGLQLLKNGQRSLKFSKLKPQSARHSLSNVDRGQLLLGHTLPDLLDMEYAPALNHQALNEWRNHQWQSLSTQTLRQDAEEIALGLLALGCKKGDRIPLVMHSNVDFCRVDLGCLLAGLVDVPIDLTQTIENILFILNHTQAKVMVVANLDLLEQLVPYLWEASTLQHIIVAEVPSDWADRRTTLMRQAEAPTVTEFAQEVPTAWECLHIPQFLREGHSDRHPAHMVPPCIQLVTLAEVQRRGQPGWNVETVAALRAAIAPTDLATIIYIASETQRPKGVMLSHENISANALTAFSSYPNLKTGAEEVALLFLPLTHIFARVFLYGHLAYGHTVYLSDPNHLLKHLRQVQPTFMITVPRLLEKVYERVLESGSHLKGVDRQVFDWALSLAQRYKVGQPISRLYALQLQLADRLVFSKWRASFGDRLKALISGGAALRPELVNLFTAAGLPVLQGYGLTETGGVVCYNRGVANRAGTVGWPIAGVEFALAQDHEILIRAPFVMQGYFQDSEATQTAFDADGWFHTGDLGSIDADGFLTITGVKKSLFKLSTGKYVSSQPLEAAVMESHLVKAAIAVGANHKFCGMLIFPNLEALAAIAKTAGLSTEAPDWWQHPALLMYYQLAIDAANCHLPYWSTVRQFQLLDSTHNPQPTLENGGRLPNGQINRTWVTEQYAAEIQALYSDSLTQLAIADLEALSSNVTLTATCPINAKSLLNH